MSAEDPWAAIRAAGGEIASRLNTVLERIDHLLAEAARFGERGWPFHPDWDSSDLAEIVDASGGQDYDGAFMAFYDAEDAARVRGTFAVLAASDGMSKWHLIVRQAEAAFEREHYALIVPALVTVLEGRVFSEPDANVKVISKVKSIAGSQTDEFSKMVTVTGSSTADHRRCGGEWMLSDP